MNARTRGPQPPPATIWASASARHRDLRRGVTMVLPHAVRRGVIDPLSYRVACEIDGRHRPAWFLLAASRLRWNECAAVDLARVWHGHAVEVPASKGSASRVIQPVPPSLVGYFQRVSPKTPLIVTSYDQLCAAIHAAIKRASLRLPTGSNSATHAARHFWASWRASQGATVEDIARGLGHRSQRSTLHYIHDSAELLMP